ncbi:MAG: hypothetical protein ACPG32_03465 [Akkermansiaceae bacterium]
MKVITKIAALLAIAIAPLLISSCADNPPPRRSSSYTSYQVKPRVTIRNNSHRSIAVGVRGPETRVLSVPARTSRTFYLKSGVYKYAAAARGVKTISGYKAFSGNRTYTWNFGVN